MRRRWRWAVALVVAGIALGCGIRSGDDNDEPGDQPGGGPGAPVNEDPPASGGVGAPINIPNITNAQGDDIDDVRERMENELRAVCGGDVCVRLEIRVGDNEIISRCEFVTTDPPMGTAVERGSTVYLVVGMAPCETQTTPTGPSTTRSTTTPPTSRTR